MFTSRQVLIGASVVATALIASPSEAQYGDTRFAAPGVDAHTARLVPSRATGENAARYMEEGRYRDALRVFRRIAAEQRAHGEYPLDALRGVVRAEFALGDERGTARALDELADEASRFGDPETRIRSLFQAALIYQRTSNRHHVEDRLAAIRTLLKSPAISEETRRDISTSIPRP